MTGEGDPTQLLDVTLVNLPVEQFWRSQQHHDALLREFALVAVAVESDHEAVPARLLALVRQLTARFGRLSAEPEARLRDAMEQGVATVDLRFQVPPAAKDAAVDLGRLLDEADEYCRQGALLTLATPPDVLAFRRRYLEEFVRQIGGAPPRPWERP